MFSEAHPDSQRADRILASIRREEARSGRGLLKIFFGMAPGVGKTYAMLEAAIQAADKGVEVVIGVAESHGREDTMRLIGRLPRLPMKKVAYRGVEMEEFDLEEALRLKPRLILVDELAHTNVPGLRHKKRYQDVEELLAAGIDVYTTLNVQHLESRADTVQDITAAPVQETVPDSVLAEADCIQLVDIAPDQLRARLREGKVYGAPQASAALDHFFRESNLTALRELALRIMAEKVDHELTEVRTISGDRSIWRSGERLMVAVGPSPFSARLVRWTRRMAYALNAPWIALSVDTGVPLSPEQQQRLDANLELARRLGAEVVVMPGSDLAETLLRMAFLRNVSQIVVGKPQESYLWGLLRPISLVDKLVKGSGQIDIYVVPAAPGTGRSRWKSWHRERERNGRDYWLAAGVTAAVTVLGLLMAEFTGYFAPGFLYLAGVVGLGFFIRSRWAVLMAAALSALLWNLLFIPPVLTFKIERLEDALMCVFFFLVALSTGRLTSRLRVREQEEREREKKTNALFLYSRAIASAADVPSLVSVAVAQMSQIMGVRMAAMVPVPVSPGLKLCETGEAYPMDEKEWGVASWCFKHRQAAGRFTDTLPVAEGFYFPMMSGERCMGVLGVKVEDGERLTVGQRDLLESMGAQLALALEREEWRAERAQRRLMEESEKLHRSLLDSVSHEFKTPLAVIEGGCEKLAGRAAAAEEREEFTEIMAAARRLRRLVKNLLDVTRLESGALRPRLDWCDLGDVVECALAATREARRNHPVSVSLPPDYPLVKADFSLMEQVLVNLLLNACVHTPAGTPMTLKGGADPVRGQVWLDVHDLGPGIPPELAESIFERFRTTRPGGLGLGLPIVRGFMEAQRGTVTLVPVPAGTCFRLVLPLVEHDHVPEE